MPGRKWRCGCSWVTICSLNGTGRRSARRYIPRKPTTFRSPKVVEFSIYRARAGINSPARRLCGTAGFADDARRTFNDWKAEFETGLVVENEQTSLETLASSRQASPGLAHGRAVDDAVRRRSV